jgi:hypothetical protein
MVYEHVFGVIREHWIMDSFQHSVATAGGGQATFSQCWFGCYRMLLGPSGQAAGIETKLRGLGYNDNGNGYIIHNNPFPGPKDAIQVTTTTANTFVKFITNARASVQGLVVK